MPLPDELCGLLDPAAYPHACARVQLVETHISWVLLTGTFAYKLKKPVRLPFLDFSTLERREHFCDEELRCNRAFSPDLYLGRVPITLDADGIRVQGAGRVLDWAVKMREFPGDAQLDRLLAAGRLDADTLRTFGVALAEQHRRLPSRRVPAEQLDQRVLGPIEANFDTLMALARTLSGRQALTRIREAARLLAQRHRALLARRLEDGFVRECHGDLHLANLVLLDGRVRAFDCLEFDPDLRWIDPWSDVGFLFMDCLVRERADLGYAFVDGYLESSADYQGAPTLPLYAGYRAMVRAKVAALRHQQAEAEPDSDTSTEATEGIGRESRRYLDWTARYLRRPPGLLLLMCGLSGSGKSYLAERLAPTLAALRFRSDVARKSLAGLAPTAASGSAPDRGLYAPAQTERVYQRLYELAEALLLTGENVILDATFGDGGRRRHLLARARAQQVGALVIYCTAPEDVLQARVAARQRGSDPSEADLGVLEMQRARFEVPDAAEPVVRVDTRELDRPGAMAELCARIRERARL